jgi:hypothetical protein
MLLEYEVDNTGSGPFLSMLGDFYPEFYFFRPSKITIALNSLKVDEVWSIN